MEEKQEGRSRCSLRGTTAVAYVRESENSLLGEIRKRSREMKEMEEFPREGEK
jgi:hypothetical protein